MANRLELATVANDYLHHSVTGGGNGFLLNFMLAWRIQAAS